LSRHDWANLRFLDFKIVEAYNTAIHRIVAQLRFCGQNVTELEMIEKTLETFHPSNMVLQQQYRNNKCMKYCDLINVLLASEAQNQLLMKNFQMRPTRTAQPEVHANFQNEKNKALLGAGVMGAAIIRGRMGGGSRSPVTVDMATGRKGL
jgi:hypothetical protein